MIFEDWETIPYQEALDRQLAYVAEIIDGKREETIVFCTHPPVVTLGRASEESDVKGWKGETVKVSRGGRATFHGPKQLVAYPILDLSHRGKDLHKFLRSLENIIIEACIQLNPNLQLDGNRPDATGVWSGERKLAAIGIAVKRWVSYHGLAINLEKDLAAFEGISPCGFKIGTMISLEELGAVNFNRQDIIQQMKISFGNLQIK
ncbi:MAG: lipoyl(octanoyl) transferase LipB [Bdellovibrionales bacterium]